MKTAILLAAGEGTKMWPYATVRPKGMIQVSNKPIIAHLVDDLKTLGFDLIWIVAHKNPESFRSYFRKEAKVKVRELEKTKGTADTLFQAIPEIKEDIITVLYADVMLHREDLARLIQSTETTALLARHKEDPRNYIGCEIQDNKIRSITGHSRGKTSHHFLGFQITKDLFPYLSSVPNLFQEVEVGMMVPNEQYLESCLIDWMKDGNTVKAIETKHFSFDLDKPWHLLEANSFLNRQTCNALEKDEIGENALIHPDASIEGFVRLGKNSKIGKNVIIEGNVWIGDNTVILHGAILKGNNVIGDHCEIGYSCFIEKNSTVGSNSKILHCAELSGMIMPGVYLYHYMEINGIVGENTDIGAGTVCGSLRFDDKGSSHKVKGRRENPENADLANACFIGDFSRTGINAILLPGIKTGARSVVGPGIILSKDLEENKAVFVKQEQVIMDWGSEKYGW